VKRTWSICIRARSPAPFTTADCADTCSRLRFARATATSCLPCSASGCLRDRGDALRPVRRRAAMRRGLALGQPSCPSSASSWRPVAGSDETMLSQRRRTQSGAVAGAVSPRSGTAAAARPCARSRRSRARRAALSVQDPASRHASSCASTSPRSCSARRRGWSGVRIANEPHAFAAHARGQPAVELHTSRTRRPRRAPRAARARARGSAR